MSTIEIFGLIFSLLSIFIVYVCPLIVVFLAIRYYYLYKREKLRNKDKDK